MSGSVEKYLNRVQALASSDVEGAKEAWQSLVKRGLSKTAIKEMKNLIAECRADVGQVDGPRVDPAKIAAGAQARRDAYDRVSAWYNDWAETLRPRLTYHQAIRLGIVAAKGGRRPSPGEPETSDKAVDEGL